MGWKHNGHGDAFRRLSPPWFMRCASMDGKAKTWPQGVICGQIGASKEMGQLISCAVNISTCSPVSASGQAVPLDMTHACALSQYASCTNLQGLHISTINRRITSGLHFTSP